MQCIKCEYPETSVKDSRKANFGLNAIRRRRLCLKCGERWTTYEIPMKEEVGIKELMNINPDDLKRNLAIENFIKTIIGDDK